MKSFTDKKAFEHLVTFVEPEQLAHDLETKGYAQVFEFNTQIQKLAMFVVESLGLKVKKVKQQTQEEGVLVER